MNEWSVNNSIMSRLCALLKESIVDIFLLCVFLKLDHPDRFSCKTGLGEHVQVVVVCHELSTVNFFFL